MHSISRETAKNIVACSKIRELTEQQLTEILSAYWRYDSVHEAKNHIKSGDLPDLTEEALGILVSVEKPIGIDRELFAPLIIDYLISKLEYSTNEYLEVSIRRLGRTEKVEGEVENAGQCPCCGYLSIADGEDGLWDICPVCFWENGGDGPNHICLSDARRNFEEFGALDRRSLQYIDPEARVKYAKKALPTNMDR
ncbi:MAG: hypothetical protein RL095_4169 [Verrucomicrobiota bacterium]